MPGQITVCIQHQDDGGECDKATQNLLSSDRGYAKLSLAELLSRVVIVPSSETQHEGCRLVGWLVGWVDCADTRRAMHAR